MEEYKKEEQTDIRDYLRVLIKRRWSIITFFTITVLTVAIHTFTSIPIYQAGSRIVIEKENPNLVSIQEVMAVDATGSDYYQTQYKIIESRTVAREVIRRMDLENSAEFFPESKNNFISNIKGWFRETAGFLKEWTISLLNSGDGRKNDKLSLVETTVSIIDTKEDWYHVELEDGRTGWAHKSDFAVKDITFLKSEKNLPERLEFSVEGLKEVKSKVHLAIARHEPVHDSKIVFRMIKERLYSVIDTKEDWYHIKLEDGRTGWAHKSDFVDKIVSSELKMPATIKKELAIVSLTSSIVSAYEYLYPGSKIKFKLKKGNRDRKIYALSPDFTPDSGLVSAFIGRINISPIRNSRLVDVSFEAKNPVLAAQIANELVRTYIDMNMEIKLTATKDAVKWLNDRIGEERTKVEAAENALLQYKEEQEIITDFSSDAEKITAQKLAQINAKVVDAESLRVEAETRYMQAMAIKDNPDMLDSIPRILSNELIQQIKNMEVNLYNRMSEFSDKYGQNHPKMVAIESELEDLKKRKAIECKRVVNSLQNEYKLAVAREESLKKALARQKTESLSMNKKAVQYGVLQRQTESSRHMYELLIKRFKETSLTEEMKTGNIRIIDKAETPESPVKPKKKLNLLLSIIVGLAMGTGLAFFLEYLDNTIKLPDEIKEYLKIPYLGPVPAFASSENHDGTSPADLIAVHSPKSTASESFRGIRTGILFSSADAAPQVILVSSAGPEEGKTSCAANLAVTMAQAGSNVLIIDCDMRRPRVHKLFNIGRDAGISSVLVGSSELNDVVVNTDIANLDIIPCGPIPPNPSELLGSRKMEHLVKALRKKYTRIIIDSPPLTAVTDSVLLSKIVDGTILVIRAGETPRQVVQNGLSQLHTVNAHILGAVLNGVTTGKDSYYYYQYYYYYYGDDSQRNKKKNKKRRIDD